MSQVIIQMAARHLTGIPKSCVAHDNNHTKVGQFSAFSTYTIKRCSRICFFLNRPCILQEWIRPGAQIYITIRWIAQFLAPEKSAERWRDLVETWPQGPCLVNQTSACPFLRRPGPQIKCIFRSYPVWKKLTAVIQYWLWGKERRGEERTENLLYLSASLIFPPVVASTRSHATNPSLIFTISVSESLCLSFIMFVSLQQSIFLSIPPPHPLTSRPSLLSL